MLRPVARILAVASLLLLVIALAAQARPLTRREFVTIYPKAKGTRIDACATCHAADGVSLNAYGAALKKAGVSFQAVEKLDSDADGVSNRLEILGLSFPGDPKDRPGARRDSASADSSKTPVRPAPGVVRPDSGARPDTVPRPPARPDSGGARPDTLKPPKHG